MSSSDTHAPDGRARDDGAPAGTGSGSGTRSGGGPASRPTWYHFVGIGGSGMSALAQLHALAGGTVSGSDRAFDAGGRQEIRRRLEALGVRIAPQDGTAVAARPDAVIASTAVEEEIPDLRLARELDIPVLHRSELLARFVRAHRTIAVSGTSGKSTTTAMVFEILRGAGRDPSLLTGGPLVALADDRLLGNAWAGAGDILVVEADESDGSLVRYEPWCGLVLNLQRDHKEPDELLEMFHTFRTRTRGPFVIGEQPELRGLLAPATDGSVPMPAGFGAHDAVVFGFGPDCEVRALDPELESGRSSFTVRAGDEPPVRFALPVPGRHNVLNATAAIAACRACGIRLDEMIAPLAGFAGVARRFNVLGEAGGVEVIDDFAHNPDKLVAALAAARARAAERGGRVLAVFQPHGYGPTRFVRDGLVAAFESGLRPRDLLWMPEIFYAGGTVTRDISSADIVAAVGGRGRRAEFVAERAELPAMVAGAARAGDVVIVMGARDPSLTGVCEAILRHLAGETG